MIEADVFDAMTKCDVVIEGESFRCRADRFADEWADGLLGRAESELVSDADFGRIKVVRQLFDVELRNPFYGMLTGWQEEAQARALQLAHDGVAEQIGEAVRAQAAIRKSDLEQRKRTYFRRHAQDYRAVLDALADQYPHTLVRLLAVAGGDGSNMQLAINDACPELFDRLTLDRLAEAEQRDELASM